MVDCLKIYKEILTEFLILANDVRNTQEMKKLMDSYRSLPLFDLKAQAKRFIQCNKSYSCLLLGTAIASFLKDACNDEINGIPLEDIYGFFGIDDKFEQL